MITPGKQEKVRKRHMRIKIRPVVFGLILVMLMVGASGCGMESFKSRDDKIQDTLEYLSDKYDGQEFEFEWSRDLYGKLLVYCYPEWGTYKTEPVRVRREVVDGKVQYLDSYFGILMREDAEAELVDVCTNLGLKAKVFMDVDESYYENQFDTSKTYEDYVEWDAEDETRDLRAYSILIEADDFTDCEMIADQITEAMKEKQYNYHMGVFFCTPEKYEYFDRGNLDLDEMTEAVSEGSMIRIIKFTGLKEVSN
jgi:hypothetical protein